mgnify:CR=1 FL=1
MNIDYTILLIADVVRVVVSYLILITNIRPYLKLLLLILTDGIDCNVLHFFKLYNKRPICKNDPKTSYDVVDKITDSTSYILIFIMLINTKLFTYNERQFILLLLVYRLIGVFIFVLTKNRKMLFYFPNFFLEMTLLLVLAKEFKFNYKPFIILVVIFKLMQEYILHYSKSYDKLKRIIYKNIPVIIND